MIVSFDFDGCLLIHEFTDAAYNARPNTDMVEQLKWHIGQGHVVVIVTYRTEEHEDEAWWSINDPMRTTISDFIKKHGLTIQQIIFTDHQPKGPVLERIGAHLHYDDDPAAIESAAAHGIYGILVTTEDTPNGYTRPEAEQEYRLRSDSQQQ